MRGKKRKINAYLVTKESCVTMVGKVPLVLPGAFVFLIF
jgi:hypothetical protein